MKYLTRILFVILILLGAVIAWTISDRNGGSGTPSTMVPSEPGALLDDEASLAQEGESETMVAARGACRELLLQTLDDPSNAQFGDLSEWPVRERPEGTLEVRMSGRIKDGLGEMIDAKWQCVVFPAAGQMRLVSLVILDAGGDNGQADRREMPGAPDLTGGAEDGEGSSSAFDFLSPESEGDEMIAPDEGENGASEDVDGADALDPVTGEDATDAAFPAPETSEPSEEERD